MSHIRHDADQPAPAAPVTGQTEPEKKPAPKKTVGKIFRWQGALVFLLVLGLLVGLYWLFADWLIKRSIEQIGSSFVGAKVELDKAELKLLDGTLSLQHLQITNARAPMRNLIELGEIEAAIDVHQLFWQRIHLSNVAVKNIRFDTARQSSGAIAGSEPSGVMKLLPDMAQLDWSQLSSKEGGAALLQSLDLESLKSVEKLRSDLDAAKARFEQRRAALPDQSRLDSYQARAKALKIDRDASRTEQALALIKSAKEIEALRKDIKRDIEAVKALRDDVKQSRDNLKAQYEAVKAAPKKDMDKALSQLTVNVPGTDKLVSNLLGPELEARLNQGAGFYETAAPWINKARVLAGQNPDAPPAPARFAGVTVHFPERDPQPDFWLKKAALDGALDVLGWQGSFAGQLTDVSDAPAMLAEPTRLQLDGKGNAGGTLALTAALDRRTAIAVADAALKVDALRFQPQVLSSQSALQLAAEQGLLAGELTVHQQPEQLRLETQLRFSALQLKVASDNDNAIVQAILKELAQTDAMQLSLLYEQSAAGTRQELHSSLDEIVKNAVRKVLAAELDKKKDELRAKAEEKVRAELGKLDAAWQQLLALDGPLAEQLKQLEGVLPKK
ncbi:TIGR03545 family protein [Permianibacter sp. IMCC34836]|uniref:TIGR03545 family protein n=1 Tax=Permianibacter fluminis TaxID=2738515 RepID=UPI0015578FCD|nr:TIGR03545 family protein [Permianibacter fluminis]NQD38498.1 TIGR03545 family protein [Permianibacter fluminis]